MFYQVAKSLKQTIHNSLLTTEVAQNVKSSVKFSATRYFLTFRDNCGNPDISRFPENGSLNTICDHAT